MPGSKPNDPFGTYHSISQMCNVVPEWVGMHSSEIPCPKNLVRMGPRISGQVSVPMKGWHCRRPLVDKILVDKMEASLVGHMVMVVVDVVDVGKRWKGGMREEVGIVFVEVAEVSFDIA